LSDALVVDDDDAIRELVSYALAADGFTVHTARDAREALALAQGGRLDVVVLDVNLPGGDGFHVVEEIRRFSRVPIVMLTVRHEEPDIVRALDAGADDYVVKPFSPRELVARVHTVMRRSRADQIVVVRRGGTEIAVDLATRRIHRADLAQPVDLTAAEAEILTRLLTARGRPVPRRMLRAALEDTPPAPTSRSLDVHICRLRQKLDPPHAASSVVETVRGIGYRWAGEADLSPSGRVAERPSPSTPSAPGVGASA